MPNEVRQARRRRYHAGLYAEGFAAVALWCKGYKILAWRYKTKQGEIDLVARKGGLLVFVEVKARKMRGTGLDAVTETAWRRIARAAAHFHARYRDAGSITGWRYDLVVVTPCRWPYHQPDTYRPPFD